ncbi:unnamed protein product [Rhizoctonia solani]|uniref:Uncharacterized protein n=1 Tax=Rhizoctonia solani TaxID=456999 RepID=A0A8H2XBC2_9AGAM|nr:unnamed protein product [Rhizoctonia solani]
MLNTPSKSLHPRWGRDIRSYPAIYTNKAITGRLKVPVKARDRAALRTIGLRAIEEICMLGNSKVESSEYNEIFESITLQKLESVLEFTRFPNEYENFAIPKLVAGCIELLSYTTPSPFAYEYGYLCFRILVFALNTCFLKYAGAWEETVDEMQNKSSGLHTSCFWDRSAMVALEEVVYYGCEQAMSDAFDFVRSRRWSVPYFDQQKLDNLISILHSDRKNFFIALRDTGSLGLSSLFFILQRHIKSKQPKMEPAEFVEKIAVPFSRVFYRYQIVLPNFAMERFASRHLFLGNLGDFTDTLLIDMDDSRNVLRAYINSVKPPHYRCEVFFGDGIPLNFLLPHVVPGCEDLIPGLFEAAMQVLWNALLDEDKRLQGLNHYVRLVMYHFHRLLDRLHEQVTSSRAIEDSWIYKLADKIVDNDVVGLILRAILLELTPEPENLFYNQAGPRHIIVGQLANNS